MKTRLLMIIGMSVLGGLIIMVISNTYAQCTLNDDWPDRPCLDGGTRGSYFQSDVDKWRYMDLSIIRTLYEVALIIVT